MHKATINPGFISDFAKCHGFENKIKLAITKVSICMMVSTIRCKAETNHGDLDVTSRLLLSNLLRDLRHLMHTHEHAHKHTRTHTHMQTWREYPRYCRAPASIRPLYSLPAVVWDGPHLTSQRQHTRPFVCSALRMLKTKHTYLLLGCEMTESK